MFLDAASAGNSKTATENVMLAPGLLLFVTFGSTLRHFLVVRGVIPIRGPGSRLAGGGILGFKEIKRFETLFKNQLFFLKIL